MPDLALALGVLYPRREPAGTGSADGDAGPSLSPPSVTAGGVSEYPSRALPCLCPAATGRCDDDCSADPGSEYCTACTINTGGRCHG